MKNFILSSWETVMDNRHNPLRHLDLASQHYIMQVLGWMWSMVFSLTFLSIFHFGITWALHLFVFGGIAMTVAIFRESQELVPEPQPVFNTSSACLWKADSEA